MCDYCEEMKSIYIGGKGRDLIQEIYIEIDGTMSITPNYPEEIFNGINFKINYCPICGAKLAT